MALFGAHITSGPRNRFGELLRANARAVLSVDQDIYQEVLESNGGYTTVIHRTTHPYMEAPGDLFQKRSTEQYWDADRSITWDQLAEYWYPQLEEKFVLNRADYYCFTNEQGGGEGPTEEIRQNYFILVNYERAMAKIHNAKGRKACVLNLATGSPGDFDIWKEICAPFIAEMWAEGNIYGRHAYGEVGGDLVDINGEMFDGAPFRPIQEILYLNDRGHYGGVVITECGLDAGMGFAGIDRFTFQMTKYCEELLRYDLNKCIIGICGWNLGHWKASNASYTPAIPRMVEYMLQNTLPEWVWPEDIDPPPPTETFEQKAWRITSEMQVSGYRAIQLNAESAIQKAISWDNVNEGLDLQIVSMEEWVDGNPVVAAESLGGLASRRVYVYDTSTGVVWFFLDPGTDPPPPPPTTFSLSTYPIFMVNPHVTAPFNQQRSYGRHEGIDLRVWNSPGDALPFILSGAPNGVIESIRSYDPGTGYGKYVRVAYYGFEPGVVWKVWYCHLSEVQPGLRAGDDLVEGQALGTAGNTGNSTGPHLHLTVQRIPGGLSGYVIESVVDPHPLIEALTEPPPPPPPPTGLNISSFLFGDGRRYYLRTSDGRQELHQTQYVDNRIYHVKNNPGPWESFFLTTNHICRDTDTSPGGGRYYTLRDHIGDIEGSRWLPVRMNVGEVFVTNPLRVQFYNKSDCSTSPHQSGDVQNSYRLVALHESWTSRFGYVVPKVVEIHWVNGNETYFYGENYGLVGWERGHRDPNTFGWSSLVSLPEDGHNEREHIHCL